MARPGKAKHRGNERTGKHGLSDIVQSVFDAGFADEN